MTEETDAVVVVVSEERGTISFCFNGNIVPNLDGASLKQALLGLFGQRARAKKKAAAAAKRNSMTTTGTFRASTLPPPASEKPANLVVRTSVIPPPDDSLPAGRITMDPLAARPMQPSPPVSTPMPTPLPLSSGGAGENKDADD